MKQPHDLLLSTLNSYLRAIGGTARMIVLIVRFTGAGTSARERSAVTGGARAHGGDVPGDVRLEVVAPHGIRGRAVPGGATQ